MAANVGDPQLIGCSGALPAAGAGLSLGSREGLRVDEATRLECSERRTCVQQPGHNWSVLIRREPWRSVSAPWSGTCEMSAPN